MSYTFNPFTGKFDYYTSGSGSSDPTTISKTAAENISALQFVYSDTANTVRVATSVNGKSPIGIATNAALTSAAVTIRLFGEVQDVTFAFGADDLFLNSTGFATDTPVLSGFHTRVAKGMGSGSIFIDIDETIELI